MFSPRGHWPRGQNFGLGLGLKDLASASASASKLSPRPRPQTSGLGLASISLSYYVIGHFSGKNRVKFRNFVHFFPAIILNRMLLIIIWYFFHNYFWPRPWLQPPEIGLGLVALASASRFWPRLTSITDKQTFCLSCLTSYLGSLYNLDIPTIPTLVVYGNLTNEYDCLL